MGVREEVISRARASFEAGDYGRSAAIAAEVGLLAPGGTVIEGADLPAADRDVADLLDRPEGAVVARVSPADKLRIARALRTHGHVVAMTGDGVNDAPALARATVGVAMGAAGTDVALETADVVLMTNDFAKLNHAVTLSRRTKSIVYQNLALALGVIAVLVLLVLSRGLVLALGVIGHEGSTVLVVFNSLRLLLGQHRSGPGPSSAEGGREAPGS